jgi:hypothetical protein
MFTWKKIDLPTVPDVFLTQARDIAEQNANTSDTYIDVGAGYRHRVLHHQGRDVVSRCQIAQDMGEEWQQWVKENIVDSWLETGVRINNDNGSDLHGPHTDPPVEKYKLYYLVESGGDDVHTCWYREKGAELTRLPGTVVVDYNNVEKIDDTVIPTGQWILFNTNVLHGIEGAKKQRINLTITLPPDHDFLSKYLT